MNANEVIVNEEVLEAVECPAITPPVKVSALATGVAVVAAVGVGFMLVKKVVIPACKKFKAKKAAKVAEAMATEEKIEVDYVEAKEA